VVLGGTTQLTATARDARGQPLTGNTVAWASGDEALVTVSATGLVSGVATGGPVVITASSEGKKPRPM
jgi:uncharacterized protein YjdB